jgi:ACR3 family arsenite efflux pump ArsB
VIRRALKTIKGNLIHVVVASLAAGLLFGQVADAGTKSALQATVVPILFLMIYPMMINIDLREVVHLRRHAWPVGLSLLVNFAVAPLLAVALARTFFAGQPGYAVGLYLVALIPTSGMTAAWTGLADGDLEAALVAMAINLLAAVAVLPVYLSVLVPGSVGFDAGRLYRQLAVVVVGPMIAGVVTRSVLLDRLGAERFERLKPVFGGLSSVGVMLIVFVAMAMRSTSILADPLSSAGVVVPLVAFYAALLVVGSALGRWLLSDAQGVSLVYATSMRNLSIAVAIAAAPGFPPTTAVLPIALAYLLQPPLGAVYMHYRRDVVGEGRSVRQMLGSVVRQGSP